MAARVFDVAVVGLGAVGSAALFQLASRGVRAVGIDRFRPPHDRGSSHGESRITRQAIGEGLAYVPLVLRSNAIWEALEAATGERLLERCGFLFITRDDAGTAHHGKAGFLARTTGAAQAFGIAHKRLDARALADRFPQFTGLVGDEQAYFEPGGGYLRPERCIAVALSEARRLGAETVMGVQVGAVSPLAGGGVRVQTDAGDVTARRAILAAGAWLPDLAGPDVGRRIEVHRQVLHWFGVDDARAYRPDASPTFIWTHGLDTRDQFYGFPPIDGEVKVAREDYGGRFDLESASRDGDPADGEAMAARHVRGRLAGLSDRPLRSRVCPYAATPDADFLIDRLGEDAAYASACSGHGFKHAAAVGEALAEWAMGLAPRCDLSPFGLARFAGDPVTSSPATPPAA